MGTSSGFIGVFNSVAKVMGGGIAGYGAIMLASVLGGLFETVLGFLLKPLRRFFPAVVTGTVVLSIGLSLVSVGVGSFGGGNAAADFEKKVRPLFRGCGYPSGTLCPIVRRKTRDGGIHIRPVC